MKNAAFRYQARPNNGWWGRDAKLYARDYQRGYDADRYNSAGGACFDD